MVFTWSLFSTRKKTSSVPDVSKKKKEKKQGKKKAVLSSSSPNTIGEFSDYESGGKDDDGYTFPRQSLSTSVLPVSTISAPKLKFRGEDNAIDRLDTSRSAPPMSSRGGGGREDFRSTKKHSSSSRIKDEDTSYSASTSNRSLYIPFKDALRRQSTYKNLGEFISLEEDPVEVAGEVLNLRDFRIVASCQGFKNVWLSRMDYGRGFYAVLKICTLENHEKSVEHSKLALQEVCLLRHLCAEEFSDISGYENIVKMYDFFVLSLENRIIIASEYCNYGSLLLFLKSYDKRFTRRERMAFAHDFTQGLGYMHRMNVAHRDFKLDNIGLTWCNDAGRIVGKLLDFGFSTISTESTREFTPLGSPGYMSPELQHRLPGGVNAINADIWAWAVTLYTLFEGTMPFEVKPSPRDPLITCEYYETLVMQDVSSFDDIMKKCFVLDPGARPTMDELLCENFFMYQPSEYIIDPRVDDMMRLRSNT